MEDIVKETIQKVLKGNKDAYAEIVDIYKERIYFVCYRIIGNKHDAEDIAQETFIKAYINLERFNLKMNFTTWIYRIATNLCIDRLRKRKPDYYLDAEMPGVDGQTLYSLIADNNKLPEAEIEQQELQQYIQAVILSLPDKYRSVIILMYLEDFSLKEISDILNIPLGTVKTRLHRGREALREKLYS